MFYKSTTDKVSIPCDHPSPSHQTTLVLQVEVGDVVGSPINLPPSPPTPLTHNFTAIFDYDSDGCDEVLSPYNLSFSPSNPLDFDVLCSPV